jgi:hypothetical protein
VRGGTRRACDALVFEIFDPLLVTIEPRLMGSRYPFEALDGGVIRREEYVVLVPFVEDDRVIFLKTIIPSRKATRIYLGKEPGGV